MMIYCEKFTSDSQDDQVIIRNLDYGLYIRQEIIRQMNNFMCANYSNKLHLHSFAVRFRIITWRLTFSF